MLVDEQHVQYDIVAKISKAELMRYPFFTLRFQDIGKLPILAECTRSCKANAAQRASQKLKVKNAHSVHISEI